MLINQTDQLAASLPANPNDEQHSPFAMRATQLVQNGPTQFIGIARESSKWLHLNDLAATLARAGAKSIGERAHGSSRHP